MSGLRALALAAALSATAGLGACGFTPLYAETGVAQGLSRIAISAPDSRFGFVLRGQLEDAFAVDGSHEPLWRLTTEVEQTRRPLGRRIDDTASRYEVTAVVRYALTTASGEPTLADAVTAVTTYAVADQPYAGITAQEDAEERLAAEAARLIRIDLSRRLAASVPARP